MAEEPAQPRNGLQPADILALMPPPSIRHRVWRILVILAPLALAAGIWLTYHRGATAGLRFSASRAEVVQSLRAAAASRGWATEGWKELADLSSQNRIRHYLETTAGPEERLNIVLVEPPALWRVRLVSDTSPRRIITGDFDPSGRLVAWRFPPKGSARSGASEEAAFEAARQELARRVGADAGSWQRTGSGIERDAETGVETRRFTFRRTFSPDLTVDVTIETAGIDVLAFLVKSRTSPDYPARHPELGTKWRVVRGVIAGVMVFVGLLYVLARFVRRFREQEIPIKRSVIVALLVMLSFGVVATVSVSTQNIGALDASGNPSDAGVYIGIGMVAILSGILLGLTWGACEADLREAYPQKLISTDAALGGLLAARPVRESLAAAFTIACYIVFLSGLEGAARAAFGIWAPVVEGELMSIFAPRPVLFVSFLSLSSVTSSVAVFIAAISITHRKGATPRARLLTAALIVTYMLSLLLATHSVPGWGLVPALIASAQLLVPFFAADLLAVIAVTFIVTWASSAATLLAQPAPALHSAGWTLLLVLAAVAAAGVIAAFRIRATNVEAARPEYAKNISERLSLAAELTTAREAQLRVMPRVVPSIRGLEIAARHSEGAEIGTDYFEFFPAADRLGIAVADARLEGLSSALCVSMLKGLLLNYTERFSDPDETVARVTRHLESVFGSDIPLSLYYGVFDPATGELRGATLGDAPRAIVVSGGNAHVPDAGAATNASSATIVVCSAALDGGRDPGDTVLSELAAAPQSDPATLATVVATRARRITSAGQRSWTVVAFRPEGALTA